MGQRCRDPTTLVAIAFWLAPVLGHAAPPSDGNVSLDWQAPRGCPNGDNVLARVRSLLTDPTRLKQKVRARGIVREPPVGGQWELALETVQGDRTYERSIRARSCDELADAAALIIALVLDPNLHEESRSAPSGNQPSQNEPSTTAKPTLANPRERTEAPGPAVAARSIRPPTPRPAAETADVQRKPAPSPPPHRRDVPIHGAVSALGDWGNLPRPTLGMEVALGFTVNRLGLELSGAVLPPVREVIAEVPERGGEIALLAAGLRACYVLEWSQLVGRACGGLEAGRMRGTGFGTTFEGAENATWIAGRLGVFALYPVAEPLHLRLGVEGIVPATRPEFVLENVGSVHLPSPVSGRLELGIELLFR